MNNASLKKEFTPSTQMIEAAELVFKTMALVETIRPIVVKYQTDILANGQWHVKPEFSERNGKEIILDPNLSYLMPDEDFAQYDAQCKVARDQAGLHVDYDNQCPLLVAEDMLRKAKRVLIESMVEITKISPERILSAGLEKYDEYIQLTLRLLTPYIRTKIL